jgi:catechol 2,3-dioxygenase-like lactoylglutathione lyase family enzyme
MIALGRETEDDALVIAGAHTLMYAEDPEAARTFFRDVLELDHVDAGSGWLIFALPPGELGIHPVERPGHVNGRHELYLMCRDITRTVAELEAKDVEFTAPVSDEGFGLLTRFKVPGAGEMWLYEPKHASPLDEFSDT